MSNHHGLNEAIEDRICRLRKALIGLKQSPKTWFDRFTEAVRNMGYWQSGGDHTLFIKHFTGKGYSTSGVS